MKEIFARRSIRAYTDQKVERDKVERLLRAAMVAPSAKNQQPWEFLVIEDRAVLDKLINTSPYTSPVGRAPLAIVMLGNTTDLKAPGYWVQDCSAATQNVLLEATSLGLGACWMGIHSNPEAEAYVRALFDLPEHIEPFALVSIGYPDREFKDRPTRYKPKKVHYGEYGINGEGEDEDEAFS